MTINELREEYREHCTRLRRYGRANSAHCYGAIGNPFPFCTICEDGECPRPTAPDKLILEDPGDHPEWWNSFSKQPEKSRTKHGADHIEKP